MKTLKYIFCLFLITSTYMACNQDDDNTDFINEIPAPSNVSALVTVTQDNTGLVTITPFGEGASTFVVNYGDGSENDSEVLRSGYSTQHAYAEGVYLIAITATGINGKTTTVTQEIVVSFQAPQNLMVISENDSNVSKQVNVIASAKFALSYEVDFGELGSTPIMGNIDDTVSFTYQEPGTYTITVTAFSAAAETTSYSEEFLVTEISVQTKPIIPVGFESPTFDYGIFSFGGANFEPIPASIINNPVSSGINTTEKVFELVKPSGAQVWAGAGLNLAGGTDFSEGTTILVDVYSPSAGTPVLYKMEDSSSPLDGNGNPTVFLEVQAVTTVANQWETLAFDLTTFAGFSTTNAYDRVIFFANFGNSGTGANYYFDNIRIDGATPPLPSIPINFESTLFNYGTFSFGGANVAIVTNPNMSGTNTSGKVFEIVKTSVAQVWAGVGMSLAGATNFANGTTINIDVWSPTAGTPILLKMEDSTSPPDGNGNPTVFLEVSVDTTVSNQWETLSFDLTSFSGFDTNNAYDTLILFPDFGTGGVTDVTYYFDNILLTN